MPGTHRSSAPAVSPSGRSLAERLRSRVAFAAALLVLMAVTPTSARLRPPPKAPTKKQHAKLLKKRAQSFQRGLVANRGLHALRQTIRKQRGASRAELRLRHRQFKAREAAAKATFRLKQQLRGVRQAEWKKFDGARNRHQRALDRANKRADRHSDPKAREAVRQKALRKPEAAWRDAQRRWVRATKGFGDQIGIPQQRPRPAHPPKAPSGAVAQRATASGRAGSAVKAPVYDSVTVRAYGTLPLRPAGGSAGSAKAQTPPGTATLSHATPRVSSRPANQYDSHTATFVP